MSVPPDQLMQMLKSQKDGATPGGVPPMPECPSAMSDTSSPPMAGPMSTPEPKMGNREAGMINLSMAQDLMEQALPSVGSDSEEGQKIISAIMTITKIIGPKKAKVNELQPTEIMQMLQNLPQAGGATPEGKAMSQAPAIPGMAPGGMPPPPPPPMPGGGAGGPPPSGMPQPPM